MMSLDEVDAISKSFAELEKALERADKNFASLCVVIEKLSSRIQALENRNEADDYRNMR